MKFFLYIILIIFLLNISYASPDWEKIEEKSVDLLRQYLKIDTSNPPGDVTKGVEWLAEIFKKHNIKYETFSVPEDPRRMHILAELPGTNPNLKPLLLLNHIDVVPADYDAWSVNPFNAEIIDGIIYGRGALDMKSLGIMQMMSMILLKEEGFTPERTIKFLGVADEEILGEYGAQWMIKNHWDKLDPQWVWDEGGIGSKDSFPGIDIFAISVAQKKSFWVDVTVEGQSGHGSRPFNNYPNQVLVNALEKIVNWQTPMKINPVVAEMFNRIGDEIGGLQGFVMKNIDNGFVQYLFGNSISSTSTSTNAMVRNTISLTMLTSGYKTNIIPEKASASLDIRLLPETDPNQFIFDLASVVNNDNVMFIPKRTPDNKFISSWDTDFFKVLTEEIKILQPNAVPVPFMTIGGTDSQFFQSKGVDCYGLLPILVEEADIQTMHGLDERISIENFMLGNKIVYNTIKKVCASN